MSDKEKRITALPGLAGIGASSFRRRLNKDPAINCGGKKTPSKTWG